MSRSDIPLERLIAYAAGDLDPRDATEVRNALSESPESAAFVERYQTIVGIARSDRSVEPSARVLADAKALFANRHTQATPGLLDGLMRFIAELVHDSRPQAALAGVRGAGTAFQLSFQSEIADVDLDFEPAGGQADSFRVMGQISPRQPQTRIEQVAFVSVDPERSSRSVQPDDGGTFTLEIEPGSYVVHVKTADALVVLSDVNIE